jgi:hypothetical protein
LAIRCWTSPRVASTTEGMSSTLLTPPAQLLLAREVVVFL